MLVIRKANLTGYDSDEKVLVEAHVEIEMDFDISQESIQGDFWIRPNWETIKIEYQFLYEEKVKIELKDFVKEVFFSTYYAKTGDWSVTHELKNLFKRDGLFEIEYIEVDIQDKTIGIY